MEDIYKEIISEQRKSNKRFFITIIVILIFWVTTIFGGIAGFLWYVNNFETVSETTQVIEDTETTENSQIMQENE